MGTGAETFHTAAIVDTIEIDAIWWRHIPAGAEVLHKPVPAHDNRWQRGAKVDAFYLSDSAETAYAEWYRTLARLRAPVLEALPFDLVRFHVMLDRVADLSDVDRLASVGLPVPRPGTAGWATFQTVGEQLHASGFEGLIAPTDARPDQLLLCIFRQDEAVPGVQPLTPVARIEVPPLVPIGMST
jgi:RES domain-containing protein